MSRLRSLRIVHPHEATGSLVCGARLPVRRRMRHPVGTGAPFRCIGQVAHDSCRASRKEGRLAGCAYLPAGAARCGVMAAADPASERFDGAAQRNRARRSDASGDALREEQDDQRNRERELDETLL